MGTNLCRIFLYAGDAGLIVFYAGSFRNATGLIICVLFVESADARVQLYTKAEIQAAIDVLKQEPDFTAKLLDITHGASSGSALTPDGQAFANSRPRESNLPEGKQPQG